MHASRGPANRKAGVRAPSRQARPDDAGATESTELARALVVESLLDHRLLERMLRDPSGAPADALAVVAQHGPPALLKALARQPKVATGLASAIVARGEPDAVDALMANPGAEIDREAFARALAARPDDDRLHAALVARAVLPPEIVQRLGVLVAADRLPQLVRRHAAPPADHAAATPSGLADATGAGEPVPARSASPMAGHGLTKPPCVAANVHR